MTDTTPSVEEIIAKALIPYQLAGEGTWQEQQARLVKKALFDAGQIIVDKDELQDICNAIAVGDQASAWEKLTSMTKDIGSGEEQEEGFFGGKSIPPPWDTGS